MVKNNKIFDRHSQFYCLALKDVDCARSAVSKWRIYGHVVSELAHASISTDDGGKYGSVKPAPIALLPGARAKLLPTGGVLPVPTEIVPTFTHPVSVFSMIGGTGNSTSAPLGGHRLIYGHVVSVLGHAPASTEDAGRYGLVMP